MKPSTEPPDPRALTHLSAAAGEHYDTPDEAWDCYQRAVYADQPDAADLLARFSTLDETVDVTVYFSYAKAHLRARTAWRRPNQSDFWWLLGKGGGTRADLSSMLGTVGVTPTVPTATLDLRLAALVSRLLLGADGLSLDSAEFAGPVGRAFASLDHATGPSRTSTAPLLLASRRPLWAAALAVVS